MNSNGTTLPVLASVIAALTACSSPAPTVEPGATTAAASSPVAPAPVTPTTAVATPSPSDRSAKFGDTVTFEDGSQVKVTSGGLIPASPNATGAVEGKIAVLNLTVTAGRQELDASKIGLPRVRLGTTGKQAQTANDDKIGGNKLSTIRPGETQTVKFGYGIAAADAKNVRVEVSAPDLTGAPAIFMGEIG